jgi:hypothetical protein
MKSFIMQMERILFQRDKRSINKMMFAAADSIIPKKS